MTFREALATAIDFIRASGTEERGALQAAKALERKAERLRARTEAPAAWEYWCECGERRPKDLNFCHDCYRLFPFSVVQAFLIGTAAQSRKAFRQMRRIARERLQKEAA